jgi:hypothetical protein
LEDLPAPDPIDQLHSAADLIRAHLSQSALVHGHFVPPLPEPTLRKLPDIMAEGFSDEDREACGRLWLANSRAVADEARFSVAALGREMQRQRDALLEDPTGAPVPPSTVHDIEPIYRARRQAIGRRFNRDFGDEYFRLHRICLTHLISRLEQRILEVAEAERAAGREYGLTGPEQPGPILRALLSEHRLRQSQLRNLASLEAQFRRGDPIGLLRCDSKLFELLGVPKPSASSEPEIALAEDLAAESILDSQPKPRTRRNARPELVGNPS